MRKLILLIALTVASMVTSAQSLFDTLEDMDGVDMLVVNKDMFELLSKFNPDKMKDNKAMQIFAMINDLKSFKRFSTDDSFIADKMEIMINTAIKKHNLTELMRIKEDDSRIKIYVKATKNKEYVSEVLMFIKGIDKQSKGISKSMIMSLTGVIDITKMSDLADTFTQN